MLYILCTLAACTPVTTSSCGAFSSELADFSSGLPDIIQISPGASFSSGKLLNGNGGGQQLNSSNSDLLEQIENGNWTQVCEEMSI